jgi:hypothetical protein
MVFPYVLALVSLAGCHENPKDHEGRVRAEFQRMTGSITLPPGVTEIHQPLQFARGAHDIDLKGDPAGSTLRLAMDFHGSAAVLGANVANARLEGFQIIGDRSVLATDLYLPPSNVSFADT